MNKDATLDSQQPATSTNEGLPISSKHIEPANSAEKLMVARQSIDKDILVSVRNALITSLECLKKQQVNEISVVATAIDNLVHSLESHDADQARLSIEARHDLASELDKLQRVFENTMGALEKGNESTHDASPTSLDLITLESIWQDALRTFAATASAHSRRAETEISSAALVVQSMQGAYSEIQQACFQSRANMTACCEATVNEFSALCTSLCADILPQAEAFVSDAQARSRAADEAHWTEQKEASQAFIAALNELYDQERKQVASLRSRKKSEVAAKQRSIISSEVNHALASAQLELKNRSLEESCALIAEELPALRRICTQRFDQLVMAKELAQHEANLCRSLSQSLHSRIEQLRSAIESRESRVAQGRAAQQLRHEQITAMRKRDLLGLADKLREEACSAVNSAPAHKDVIMMIENCFLSANDGS